MSEINALAKVMKEMDNHFQKRSTYLLVHDTNDLADGAVIDTGNQIEQLGQYQYDALYATKHLLEQTKDIKRNQTKRIIFHYFVGC